MVTEILDSLRDLRIEGSCLPGFNERHKGSKAAESQLPTPKFVQEQKACVM